MLYRVIDATELPALVEAFMESYEVVAPVKRDRGYAFEAIESPDQIVLDYVSTIVSPKKFFLPPEEPLFSFDRESNDVTEFKEMMDTVTEGCPPMPTEMFSAYLDRLDREDMEDEGHFVWMIQELNGQTPLLMMALDIFRDGRPECSLTDRDSLVFRRVMDLMDRASERCSGQDPEILDGITEYISVTRDECSVLLRIASLGNVESQEISRVCISLGTVTEEGFDSMFGDVLDSRESEALSAFRREMPRYVAAMYARCAFNSDYPLSSERSLSPRNRFQRLLIHSSLSHRNDSDSCGMQT